MENVGMLYPQSNKKLIRQSFRKYLVVTILVSLSSSLGLLINNIIAGNLLGADAVAAIGIALPVFILFMGLSGMLESGAVALSARAVGRRDSDAVNGYFSVAAAAAVAFGLVCFFACFFFSEQLAVLLGAKDSVLFRESADYLKGLSFAAGTIILFQLFMGFIRLDNDPKLGLTAITILCICDIGLNVLAVGVLKTGIIGMGVATALAYLIGTLICCAHFFKKANTLTFVNPLQRLRTIGAILATGSPNSTARICVMIRTLVFNYLLMMVAGPAAVTAHSMVTSVNAFVSSVTIGIGQTGTLLSGIFFGEEDKAALRTTIKTGLRYGLTLCLLLCVSVIIFAGPVVNLFGITGGEAYTYGVTGIRCFCIGILIGLTLYLFMNFYTSTGNIKAALSATIAQSAFFSTLSALCLVWFLGANGVWYSFFIGEALALLAAVIVAQVTWRGRPKGDLLDKMMHLPKDFQTNWKASASFVCSDMASVVACSRQIEAFCLKEGISEKQAYQLALAVEEMAGNIVAHGFKDTRNPEIEVKVIVKENGILLRIRDNGRRFNPLDYDIEASDAYGSIGIKMIRKTISNIDYRNTLGMNNLIITL